MKHTAYRLFKKPFFGRFMRPWRWPDGIDQGPWQRLSIASGSGARLAALLAEAHTPEAKGAVLLAHPMGTAAKGFWLKQGHAELLRRAGYHVMLFDLNGFGESSSTTMDYPLDVLAAGQAAGVALTRIGRITAGPGLRVLDAQGLAAPCAGEAGAGPGDLPLRELEGHDGLERQAHSWSHHPFAATRPA